MSNVLLSVLFLLFFCLSEHVLRLEIDLKGVENALEKLELAEEILS